MQLHAYMHSSAPSYQWLTNHLCTLTICAQILCAEVNRCQSSVPGSQPSSSSLACQATYTSLYLKLCRVVWANAWSIVSCCSFSDAKCTSSLIYWLGDVGLKQSKSMQVTGDCIAADHQRSDIWHSTQRSSGAPPSSYEKAQLLLSRQQLWLPTAHLFCSLEAWH